MSPAAIKKQEKQSPLETFDFSELDTAYATTQKPKENRKVIAAARE